MKLSRRCLAESSLSTVWLRECLEDALMGFFFNPERYKRWHENLVWLRTQAAVTNLRYDIRTPGSKPRSQHEDFAFWTCNGPMCGVTAVLRRLVDYSVLWPVPGPLGLNIVFFLTTGSEHCWAGSPTSYSATSPDWRDDALWNVEFRLVFHFKSVRHDIDRRYSLHPNLIAYYDSNFFSK
jgi:hypothetical protein